MNILFVTQFDLAYPDSGGPVFKVRYLSNYLADLGHNVKVVTVEKTFVLQYYFPSYKDLLHDLLNLHYLGLVL